MYFDLLANTRVCSFGNVVNSKDQCWMGIWYLLITISSSYFRDPKNHPVVWKNRMCSGRLFDRIKNNWDPWFIYNCSLLTIVSSLSSWVWPVLVAKFGLMKMFKFDLGYLWCLEENQNNWRFMVYTRIWWLSEMGTDNWWFSGWGRTMDFFKNWQLVPTYKHSSHKIWEPSPVYNHGSQKIWEPVK